MATRKQLRARWKTAAGKLAIDSLENALRAGADRNELIGYVADLPHADEVAPDLDLRGVELPTLLSIGRIDLTGTRFDFARLSLSFGGATLRNAVFDHVEGSNVHFGGSDLRGSSFVDARLPGAIFLMSKLGDADMSGIRMHSGQLKDADCQNVQFVGADLRMVWAAGANIRGADFTDANLVGASLGGATWDSSTIFAGARLSHEGTPAEIIAHAIQQGATLDSESREWELGLIDATAQALSEQHGGESWDRVIERIAELRSDVEADPSTLWANTLRDELTAAQWSAVQDAVRSAALNMGAWLDHGGK